LFLNAVYSESLFLAALLASFYFLESKRLWPACLGVALAVLTRPQGILALPALLWLAWRRIPERRTQALLWILLASLLPLAGFLFFLNQTFGSANWIAWSQHYWRGEMKYPFYAMVRFAQETPAIHGQHNSWIDFSFAAFRLRTIYIVLSAYSFLFPVPYFPSPGFVWLTFPSFFISEPASRVDGLS
jgi:hypothetical protein